MAYDELLADRIKHYLSEKKANFFSKKMFGGLCFMVEEKMCIGLHFDKKKNCDLIMARIGEEATDKALKKAGCHPMDFTGRPMKGYVFISEEGFDKEEDLEYWVDLALAFNPFAKASKKRKKS